MTAWVCVCSCVSETPPATPNECTDVELIVAASDYERTVVCGAPRCLDIPGQTSGDDLGKDPQLVSTNGRTFVIARTNDLIFEVDSACGAFKRTASGVVRHHLASLAPDGRTANPHEVAAAPDGTLVVPLFNAAKLAFIAPDGTITDLPLSAYDEDGNPQADAVSVVDVGGVAKAFVTLERLDDNDPLLLSKQSSQMLRVDVATRQPEAVIELAGRNPFNAMSQLGSLLFLAEPGKFESAEEELAGIERFDTATSATSLLIREVELGGSVSEVSVSEGCGAAIVAGPEPGLNPTTLVTFDPDSGRVISTYGAPIYRTPGYDLQGLAWSGRTLYVGDRRRGPSGYVVHVFEDRGGCSVVETGRTIDLPFPPVALRAALTSGIRR